MVGSDEYLTKPFTKESLLKAVATHGHTLLYDTGPRYNEESDAGGRIVTHRQLLADVSHELTTPVKEIDRVPTAHRLRWIDADGGAWQEIDLARLAQDPGFLRVGL